jgi:hypothetical protein
MSRPPPEPHPPPTQPGARAAWEPANLTSAEVARRHDPAWLSRGDPDVRGVLRHALAALAIPLLGPLAWQLANAELAAIAARAITARGRPWIVLAKVCAIVATCELVVLVVLGFWTI